MKINIPEIKLQEAAGQGTDAFLTVVHDAILDAVGGEVNAETLPLLNGEQTTLLAYFILREEVMDGGFIQLIHNGYGPFIFLNPFAKAEALTKDCTDEQFMALFEQYPEFDDLDDEFIEMEEEVTDTIAHYVDEHLEQFVNVRS